MKAPVLTKGQKANFQTLLRAAEEGQLALVSCRRLDGSAVAVLCAMQRNDDNTISPIPLACQFDGSPYTELQDPTTTEE